MARGPRLDYPGAWHHITNRGIARRPVFERLADIHPFLESLGDLGALGLLEVHAYTVLSTHFHLLARSPRGSLPLAMQRIQNLYSRAFNRGRHRDGPLFRGRYWSRIIESEGYWQTVLLYIDRNPIQAALVARSTDYPHGSAIWYARPEGPPWLDRRAVEGLIAGWGGGEGYRPERYPSLGPESGSEWIEDFVARRSRHRGTSRDSLDDLFRAAPAEVQEWLIRKARLADGTTPGTVILPAQLLLQVMRGPRHAEDVLPNPAAWGPLLEAGLLREACGLGFGEIGRLLGVSPSTAFERARGHGTLMGAEETYQIRASEILRNGLADLRAALPFRGSVPMVPPATGQDDRLSA